jgi:hypothetical protein
MYESSQISAEFYKIQMKYLKWKPIFYLEFLHAPGHYPKSNKDVISEVLHLKLDKSLHFIIQI